MSFQYSYLAVPSDSNKLPTETIWSNAVGGCVLHLCLLPRVVNDGYVFLSAYLSVFLSCDSRLFTHICEALEHAAIYSPSLLGFHHNKVGFVVLRHSKPERVGHNAGNIFLARDFPSSFDTPFKLKM